MLQGLGSFEAQPAPIASSEDQIPSSTLFRQMKVRRLYPMIRTGGVQVGVGSESRLVALHCLTKGWHVRAAFKSELYFYTITR